MLLDLCIKPAFIEIVHGSSPSLSAVLQPAVIKHLPGPDNKHLFASAVGLEAGGEDFINQSTNVTFKTRILMLRVFQNIAAL